MSYRRKTKSKATRRVERLSPPPEERDEREEEPRGERPEEHIDGEDVRLGDVEEGDEGAESEIDRRMLRMLQLMARNQEKSFKRMVETMKPSASTTTIRRMDHDEDISDYLILFEGAMRDRAIPERRWGTQIQPLLTKRYYTAISALTLEEREDWETMEETLRAADAEANAQAPLNFFVASKNQGESFPRFCTRLTKYFNRMTDHLDTTRATKEMAVCIIIERFISTLPYQAQAYVHAKEPETVAMACTAAEEFFGNNRLSIANYMGNGRYHPRDAGNAYRDGGYQRQGGRQGDHHRRGDYQDRQGGYQRHQQQRYQRENNQEERQAEPQRHGHRRGGSKFHNQKGDSQKETRQGGDSQKEPMCYRCGEMGHYKTQCKAKVDVKLLEHLGNLTLDKKLTTSGFVEGKEAKVITLDTGADTSVVSSDLVPDTIKNHGTVIMRGLGSEIPCPQVEVDVIVKGRKLCLPALVLPRKVVGRDVLLGKTTPGLDVDWWIRSIQSENESEKQHNPKESEVIPEHREEPGVVDIKVLTRAQADRERREIEGLELEDKQSGANPTPLGSYSEGEESESEESESEVDSEGEKEVEVEEVSIPTPVLEEESTENVLPGNPYSKEEMSDSIITLEKLKREQEKDDSLRSMRESGRKEHAEFFYNQSGILCRKGTNEFGEDIEQIVLPTLLRRKAFKAAHSTLVSGHLNYKYTAQKIRPHFYWPGIYKDVRVWCSACDTCQKYNPGRGERAPLHPLPVVKTPWSWIAFDLVGPLNRTKRGHKYLLTCIDLSTRYPEAIPVKSTEVRHLIDPLFKILSQHGIPERVLTDQGPQFTSKLFGELCSKIGVEHVMTTPYRPQSNGCLERFHKTFKLCLAKSPESSENWDLLTPYVLFALREATNRSTGHSPFSLLYGRPIRGPASILAQSWKSETALPTSVEEILTTLKDRLETVSAIASQKDTQAKAKRKTEFDKQATAKELEIGQQVLVRIPRESKGKRTEWKGPYTIMDRPSEVTYELNMRGNKRANRTFHRNSKATCCCSQLHDCQNCHRVRRGGSDSPPTTLF